MSELISGDRNQSFAPSESDEPPSSSEDARRSNRPLVRATVALAIAVFLIGLIQLIAPLTDHQFANLGALGVGAIAALFILFQVHRFVAARSQRLLVPVVTVLSLAIFVSLFRFEGWSGEMWPQFQFRYSKKLELQTEVATDLSLKPGDDAVESVAVETSAGFLASSRSGVVNQRAFAIPKSKDEVVKLWDQGIGEGWSSFSVAGDRAVTLEQRGDDECLTCYRLSDGKLLWIQTNESRHENALGGIGPRSTPTIDGDRVYAQGARGFVWCVDLKSGDVLWTTDLLELVSWDPIASEVMITWGRAGSPLLVDPPKRSTESPAEGSTETLAEAISAAEEVGGGDPGRLCVLPLGGPEKLADSGRSLVALNADTGQPVWTAGDDQISYASPVLMTLGGREQIVSVNEKTVSGHAIADGRQLWSIEWPGNSSAGANCASPVFAGSDRVLVGKGYGGGSALIEVSFDNGQWVAEKAWVSTRVLKTKFTHACVVGDVAYAISNGSLEAVLIDEAIRLWQQPRRARFQQGQIIVADDVIVGQAESGDLVLVAADRNQYRELLRISVLDSKTWNIPTVAGRHVLVRNDRQAVCFLLPERP